MDMKKILQAMDGASTKPVEGASDMKKFVSIIQEGANPHKVSLPVQMAMQHYQQPVVAKPAREPLIGKFFQQVEDEHLQEKAERRQLINQYASTIAERVMMKESKINELSTEKLGQYKKAAGAQASAADKAGDYEKGHKRFKGIVKATIKQGENDAKKGVAEGTGQDAWAAGYKAFHDDVTKCPYTPGSKKASQWNLGWESAQARGWNKEGVAEGEIPGHSMGFTGGVGPGLQSNVAEDNQPDVVALDIPLLIRLFEYAREDAKTDMVLHDMAENMVNLCASGATLSMEDYNKIIPSDDIDQQLPEARKIKPKRKTDPCWSDYKQVGMKKKGGKQVPNCVPKKPQE